MILLPFGLWLGRLLAVRDFRGKLLVEALITVPLVLPPTVLGFYVLLATPFAAVLATVIDVAVLDKDPAEEEVPKLIFPANDAEAG